MLQSATVELTVRDVNKSIEFYKNALGFGKVMSVPDTGQFNWAMIKCDDAVIMLHSVESANNAHNIFQAPDDRIQASVFIKCRGLQNFYQRANNYCKIFSEIEETFYGTREFAIRDPDGFLIIIAEDKG